MFPCALHLRVPQALFIIHARPRWALKYVEALVSGLCGFDVDGFRVQGLGLFGFGVVGFWLHECQGRGV